MKIYLDSIGCRLNQSEIEKLGAQFRAAEHQLVSDVSKADLVVVNTCAVTVAAAADSRKKIRSFARGSNARVVATGCYATIDPKTILDLPSVEQVVSNDEKKNLVDLVLGGDYISGAEIQQRIPLPGERKRTRAFIKVQDGCDNFCTFCITRIARGKNRSVKKTEIFRDIKSALLGGSKEIVLTGVNLGSWGREIKPAGSLGSLIFEIIEKIQPPRLRLSSLEPWDIDDEILSLLDQPGFCQHLHLPLQSGSDKILKKMCRMITKTGFLDVINRIRKIKPEIALTTDIMVGFPGETEEHFLESLDFVRNIGFAGGHVFTFSMRPGTPAEKFPENIQHAVAKERGKLMWQEFEESSRNYRSGYLGKTQSVLWERSKIAGKVWQLSGLSENYLKINTSSEEDMYNQISQVKITSVNGEYITGRIVNSS